jgi:hypothetical protein
MGMETWSHGDMEAWRHGHGNIKQKTAAQAVFPNPFTTCSLCRRKFVVCLFVVEETKRNYPFANGLNRLPNLWWLAMVSWFFPGKRDGDWKMRKKRVCLEVRYVSAQIGFLTKLFSGFSRNTKLAKMHPCFASFVNLAKSNLHDFRVLQKLLSFRNLRN